MSSPLQFIVVVNDFSVFNDCVRDNPCMSRHALQVYDNTLDNIGITKRYNDFIRTRIPDDAWLVFCHQDFSFLEDPEPVLRQLSRQHLYGPIGAVRRWSLEADIISIYEGDVLQYRRPRLALAKKKVLLGQIQQQHEGRFIQHGRFIAKPAVVDTVDCCCIIAHASLIRRCGLSFDEHLDFHQYAEDFCLNARHKHGITTKAVQLSCRHLSWGDISLNFYATIDYLRSKYPGLDFAGTCPF